MNIYIQSAVAEWHFLLPRREVWVGEWMVERREGIEQGFFEVERRTFVSGPGRLTGTLKGTRCPAELESGPPIVLCGSLGCRKLFPWTEDEPLCTFHRDVGMSGHLISKWGGTAQNNGSPLSSSLRSTPLWNVGTYPPWVSFLIWPKVTQTFLILNIYESKGSSNATVLSIKVYHQI